MRHSLARAVAVIAFVGLPTLAGASMVSVVSDTSGSTEFLGSFSGTLTYDVVNANTGTLTFSLTNTSPVANGGYITGLVFDVPDPAGSATFVSANPISFLDTGADESASPFGNFDAGAALGASWLGGGSPIPGVGVGSTGTFVFTIQSSLAATLLADDFVTTIGKPGFAVRFRGFANGGSDKVPGTVPSPAGLALLALCPLACSRRRR